MRISRVFCPCGSWVPHPFPRLLRKRVGLRYSNSFGLLLLLAITTLVHAQSINYRIAGAIVNAADGSPVPHATVAVLSVADSHAVATAQSGPDGRFAFDHLPAAKYHLTASKRGFKLSFYDEHGDYSTSIVTGSRNPSNVDPADLVFRLAPGAVLRGVVTDDGGDPVERARVQLYRKPENGKAGAPEEAGVQFTDDAGGYEFSGLAAGTYFLAVTAEPWYAVRPAAKDQQTGPSALDTAYPVTYYDSTTDEASAAPIVLATGDRMQADISLHAVPALRIQIPANADGKPVPLHRLVFGQAMDMEDQAGLAPGRYELTQGDPPRVAVVDLPLGGQIDSSAGTPAVPVAVTLQQVPGVTLPGNILLTLKPVDTDSGQIEQQAEINRGRFHFPAVPPGAWELHAEGPDVPLPIVALAVNGKPQAANRITIEDHPLSITVAIRPGSLRVEGFTRKDGKGFAGAMIVLAPRDPAQIGELARRDQSDSDRSFSLFNVVPGSYTVVAIEDGWALDWSNPEVISRYLASGVPVIVPEGSSQSIKLSRPVPVQPR